jgi:hypothetical protein
MNVAETGDTIAEWQAGFQAALARRIDAWNEFVAGLGFVNP